MTEIIHYYESSDEAGRLRAGSGLLEFHRTCELLKRHLPPPPVTLLDIGGGPGSYSAWAASQGYRVHLLDPVAKHVEAAQRLGLAEVMRGDARELPWPPYFAEAALMLGPLYHLLHSEDRIRALVEARRVLKPGGILAAAAISRWASLFHSLVDGFIDDDTFWPILRRDLTEGRHINDSDNKIYFTTAAFHKPSELKAELQTAGFLDVQIYGVEGPGWLAKDFDDRWADAPRRERLLQVVTTVEQEPELAGASLHLLAVGRAPDAITDSVPFRPLG